MGIPVKATKKGYYGLKIRDPKNKDNTFEIKDEKAFSNNWMEKLEKNKSTVAVGVEFDGDGNTVEPVEPLAGGLSYKGGKPKKQ